ncbi:ankyrin repeat-containing domain protein [Mycena galopus ATCC 62051]|nr:ankyrin repeat-containing domain protein [Mycena galopus ATCC 62051]
MGLQTMVVKLLGMYGEEMAARVHTRKGAHNTQDGNTTALDRAAFLTMGSHHPPHFKRMTYLDVALAESAIAGHLEISKYLVSEGADVNFLDPRHFFDYTPLHFASRTENLGLIEFLLASGADPNLRGARGMVPLFDAADVDVAQALLSAGANIHAEDEASRNVLAFITDIHLLCFFLEQGMIVEIRRFTMQTMVVKLLAMYGEEMEARVHIRKGPPDMEYDENNTGTALDRAARHGHMEIVRILAPIRMPRRTGVQPISETHEQYLGAALAQSVAVGHVEISKYLVSEAADVNFVNSLIVYDHPPLHAASRTSHLELVQFLLASGADPNLRDNFGKTALLGATNVDVIQALLNSGADIHAADRNGWNVLTYVDATDSKLLRFLLEHGADPNYADSDHGEMLLHYIAKGIMKAQAVVQLLQFGADVERVDRDGRTPVDIAMSRGKPELVKMFEPWVRHPDLKLKIAAWWKEKAG